MNPSGIAYVFRKATYDRTRYPSRSKTLSHQTNERRGIYVIATTTMISNVSPSVMIEVGIRIVDSADRARVECCDRLAIRMSMVEVTALFKLPVDRDLPCGS